MKLPRMTKTQMELLRELMRQSYIEGMYDGLGVDTCEDQCDKMIQTYADEYISHVMGPPAPINPSTMN
jgi:hypothetical protein